MPVTIEPAPVTAETWHCGKADTTGKIFKQATFNVFSGMDEIEGSSSKLDGHITSDPNGFFNTILYAYSNHHHLVLRPDDVWFAILVQLNFYINAHAEDLRTSFVSHKGKKKLTIVTDRPFGREMVGIMVAQMPELVKENVNDPSLIEWAMPSFTTTTESDTVVAAVLIMGTLQRYFSYKLEFRCGFPSVTLMGYREDWVKLLGKLDKIPLLGAEPTQFASHLKPVLEGFLASFDKPESPDTEMFWNTCVKKIARGSGSSFMTGWLTAFCFWDQDGKPILQTCDLRNHRLSAQSLAIPTCDIPSGITTVPVTVNNLGDIFETQMVAGLAGIEATPGVCSEGFILNTLRPWTGWSMFRDGPADSTASEHCKPKGVYSIPAARGTGAFRPGGKENIPPSHIQDRGDDAQRHWVHKAKILNNWRREV